jgi:hypothetical protein
LLFHVDRECIVLWPFPRLPEHLIDQNLDQPPLHRLAHRGLIGKERLQPPQHPVEGVDAGYLRRQEQRVKQERWKPSEGADEEPKRQHGAPGVTDEEAVEMARRTDE